MRTHKNAIVCRFVVQLQQALLKKCSRDTYIWVIKMVSTGSLTQGIVCIVWTQRCQHEDKYMYTRLNEIAPFFCPPNCLAKSTITFVYIYACLYMHAYPVRFTVLYRPLKFKQICSTFCQQRNIPDKFSE